MCVNCKINVNIRIPQDRGRKSAVTGLILWLILSWTTAFAQSTIETEHTIARLLSEQRRIQPGGSFWLALQLTPEPGWHTYWKNPGDAGKATVIKWRLPRGLNAGPLLWPYPQRIRSGPLVSFGYAETVNLLTEISGDGVPMDAATLEISATADWLVCEEICIPESAVLTLSLPMASRGETDPAMDPLFSSARERLPEAAQGTAHYIYKDNRLVFDVPLRGGAAGLESMLFFPVEDNLMENASSQSFLIGENTLRVSVGAGYLQQTGPFHGVLVFKRGGNAAAEAVEFSAEPVKQLPDLVQ